MAMTKGVGKISKEAERLIQVTREALITGIKQVRLGGHTSEIGKAIQKYVEKNGFNVVRDLVGHGVGYAVHEAPEVPNFWQAGMRDCELKQGMVICLEPMVNMGACRVSFADDGWTVRTSDCSLSAHFEHTVIITGRGAIVATE
ncbi:MAG: M24 family metallopeptidase [bacterium]|nr:M24 family metallopeptidase [bacterium]